MFSEEESLTLLLCLGIYRQRIAPLSYYSPRSEGDDVHRSGFTRDVLLSMLRLYAAVANRTTSLLPWTALGLQTYLGIRSHLDSARDYYLFGIPFFSFCDLRTCFTPDQLLRKVPKT